MRIRTFVLLAACAALTGAGPAAAATIEEKRTPSEYGSVGQAYLTIYTAGWGETNDVHFVRQTEDVYVEDYYCQLNPEMCFGGQRPTYLDPIMLVTDAGARPRVACTGCASTALEVWLRDGDDRMRTDGWGTYRDVVYGMAGDDHLDVRDGNGGDHVSCGAGTDTVLLDSGDQATADCELRG